MEINEEKTEVIALNSRQQPRIEINRTIIKSSQPTYLGFTLDGKLRGNAHLLERCRKGKQKLNATLAVLNRLPHLKIDIKANIIRSCVTSVMGYGTESCYVPEAGKEVVEKLEKLQRKAARMLLQTPTSTANETCIMDLGWETMETYFNIKLLKFRARLQQAKNGSLIRACLEE